MSNIPPDPPDPPQFNYASLGTLSPVITPGTSNTNVRDNAPRGRGRGRGRGNGLGRSQRPHVNREEQPQSQAERGHRRRRPTKDRNTPAAEGSSNIRRDRSRHDDAASQRSDISHNSSRSHRTRASNQEEQGPTTAREGSTHRRGGGNSSSRGKSRRERFGGQLTEVNERPSRPPRRPRTPPPDSDLTTRLIYTLRTPPFPDCPICFNPLHPAQPTWSCSLTEDVSSCCWATFHLKCIREWARKSTKEVKDAFVARGQLNDEGYWRCPGCQEKRTQVPRTYQ